MYYRQSEDIRDDFIKFFNTLFSKAGEGKISFTNNKRVIKFSQTPKCESLDTYDFKYFPTIGVATSAASFKETHFNKLRGTVTDPDTNQPVIITGGIFTINLNFNVYALNKTDRNNLADLVGNYLSKHETKQAFLAPPFAYMIGMPSVSGDGVDDDPQTNVKYFYTTITIPIQSDFEDSSQVVDAFGNVGLTVRDVISLIASQRGSGESGQLN
jgi:hypothetical protein